MKFDFAWTLAGQPRGETPAPPPGKRTPVLPRPPACRALFRQGKRIFRAMLAVFRTGRRQHLAFGEHAPGPGVPHLAAPPKRHKRQPSYPPPSHKARLGNIRIGQRLSHGARRLACGGRIGPPRPNRLGSACWEASEIASDFWNGGFRPRPNAGSPAGTAHETYSPVPRICLPASLKRDFCSRMDWCRGDRFRVPNH